MKERIRELLGRGLSPLLVSSAVGCDPSYISLLLKDEAFALEVAQLRCKEFEDIFTRDKRYDTVEDRLLEKLENIVEHFYKPKDVLQALVMLAGVKRRSQEFTNPGMGQHVIVNNTVNLSLPSFVAKKYQLNSSNEVISINDRLLAPMPTVALMKEVRNEPANAEKIAGNGEGTEETTTVPATATYLPAKQAVSA